MAREWYCQLVGNECGPFEPAQLRAMARAGKIAPEDLVRRGTGQWVEAGKVKGLFDAAPVAAAAPVASAATTGASASGVPGSWSTRWIVACVGVGLVATAMLGVASVLVYSQWLRGKPVASPPPETPPPAKVAPAPPAKLAAEPVGDFEKLYTQCDQWGWHRVTVYGDLKEPVFALADALGWKVLEEA